MLKVDVIFPACLKESDRIIHPAIRRRKVNKRVLALLRGHLISLKSDRISVIFDRPERAVFHPQYLPLKDKRHAAQEKEHGPKRCRAFIATVLRGNVFAHGAGLIMIFQIGGSKAVLLDIHLAEDDLLFHLPERPRPLPCGAVALLHVNVGIGKIEDR